MAKTRLNMMMRSSIQKKLIARAFDHREKELMDRRPIIAKMAFDELFSPQDQAIAEALPEGWMNMTTTIRLVNNNGDNFEGWRGNGVYDLDLPFAERVPANLPNKLKASDMSDELLQTVEEHFKAEVELWDAKVLAKTNTEALLASYNWVEDLVSGWPEAASIVHEVVTAGGVLRDLPVVTNLNALLDLPPSKSMVEA